MERKMRTIQDLNLCDDFMFYEVMTDKEMAKKFLERALDVKIRDIVYAEGEKVIRGGYKGKGVRLDVYLEDTDNTVYNIEMQRSDEKNLPKRSRKYASQIDYKLLKAGEEYGKLKEQIIIFVCTFDPFGEGLYRYSFCNQCCEVQGLELGDETMKVFLNTRGMKGDVSKELKAFLRFVENSSMENAEEIGDEYVKQLAKKVQNIKNDEEIGGAFMTIEEMMEDAARDAAKEARKEAIAEMECKQAEKNRQIVEKLRAKGMTIEDIAEITGLPSEEIKKL